MVAQKLLEGNVLWAYDHELVKEGTQGFFKKIAGVFSFLPRLHKHKGEILLASSGIYIAGETELSLPLSEIEEVYMGFDDIFPASSTTNFGMFWQPIRITSSRNALERQIIYLIIDYSGFFTNNQTWFHTLIRLLK